MAQKAQTVEMPKRLPLVAEPENRDETTAKDSRILNSYIERARDGQYWWVKRPGLSTNATFTAGAGQGSYNWQGNIYSIYGGTLYKGATSLGSVDATNGVYQFSSCLGSTPQLVLGNGVKGYTYNGTTLSRITDPNFPTSFCKGWGFLDGTMYVLTPDAVIHGSGINNPPSWNALNVITAQIKPDAGVALATQLVYIVALKQWTTEIFYDAGNSTGSPLSPVQGAKANWGCVSADSVQSIDDVLYWIATNQSSATSVMSLDSLKIAKVSIKPVDRLLNSLDFSTVYSWQFKLDGHRFYGVTVTSANLTLVYDIDEQRWYQWTDANGNYWPIASVTYTSALAHLAQHVSSGKQYTIDAAHTSDDSVVFSADLYTPNMDFGVDRRKVVSMLHLEGDRIPGSRIAVRTSDDDYTTWSNFRYFDMGLRRPALPNFGTFYRRAWHFQHAANTRMRVRAGDWQIDLGTL